MTDNELTAMLEEIEVSAKTTDQEGHASADPAYNRSGHDDCIEIIRKHWQQSKEKEAAK